MIRTTLAVLGYVEAFLVTEDPHWDGEVVGEFSLLTSTSESSTRRQERNALSTTLRTKLSWSSYLDYPTAQATRSLLHSWGLDSSGNPVALQPVLCPFWPCAVPAGASSPYTSTYSVIWEPGWSNWLVYTTAGGYGAYPVTGSSLTAPLLWGTFDKLPTIKAETHEEAIADFIFLENGPASFALSTTTATTAGPAWQTLSSWPVLTEFPQYNEVETGGVDIVIARKQIGYARDEAQTVFPQTPQRIVKATFVDADASGILALFQASLGDVNPFWMPSGFSPCRLAADITSGATIQVDNATALDGQAHVLLWGGTTWAAGRIISTSGNFLTLQTAPGVFYAASTIVQPLLFGHFRSATLVIKWSDPAVGISEVAFEELPPEYGSPSGETFGTTIGPLGIEAFLYAFTDTVGSWFYTSCETAITYGGNTYTPAKIEHKTITERLNLEDSTTSITLQAFSGNPFFRYRQPRLQMAMFATISRVYSLTPAPGTATVEFTGRLRIPKFDNDQIDLEVGGPTSIFDQMLPRPLVQRSCDNCLFDSKCGLSRAAWTFSATMTPPSGPGSPFHYTISGISWPGGALPSLGASYFANGYVTRPIAGGTPQGMLILDSTAISGGSITLTLNGDIYPFPTGTETWAITPNCAGRYVEDCGTKFANQANFSGFPFAPATDPSIFPNTTATASTSKK